MKQTMLLALALGCSSPVALCGDGEIQGGEACDDGNTQSADGCRADCLGREACGDLFLDEGEACDDGNNISGDGCTSDCTKRERCGDGVVDIGEECDDSNLIDADGCEADCTLPACQNNIADPGELCLGLPSDTRVGILPTVLTFVDVNDDGLLDLISANEGLALQHEEPVLQGTISVLFGTGNGRFLGHPGHADYPVHVTPLSLSVNDLNKDDLPDIAVLNKDSDDVSILLNEGDGTFLSGGSFFTGELPASIVSFDRDADGDLDLATADTLSEQVSIFLNQGDGSFTPGETLPQSGFPRALAVGDFDADGVQDLALARLNAQEITLLLNRGASFEERTRSAPGFPVSLLTTDFDLDAKTDLAVVYSAAGEVGVLFGDGSGSFEEERRFPVGEGPLSLGVGDVSGDGLLDLVTLNNNDNDASVLVSLGGRSFAPEQRVSDLILFSSLAVGDIDNNGTSDLMLGNKLGSFGRLFYGRGDATFSKNPSFVLSDTPTKLLSADFTKDGVLDVLSVSGDTLLLSAGRGDGYLEPSTTASLGASVLDATLFGAAQIAVSLSDGSLQLFSELASPPQSLSVSGAPRSLAAFDISGDGLSDLLFSDDATGEIRLLIAQPDESFLEATPIQVGGVVDLLLSDDLDNDGRGDLVALQKTTNEATFFFGEAGGGFSSLVLPLSFSPNAVIHAEGELVVAGEGGLEHLSQKAPRSFASQALPFPGVWRALVQVDLNGDSTQEIVATNLEGEEVSVFSRELGVFSLLESYPSRAPSSLVAGDFSGDGALDLIVAEPVSNRLNALFARP